MWLRILFFSLLSHSQKSLRTRATNYKYKWLCQRIEDGNDWCVIDYWWCWLRKYLEVMFSIFLKTDCAISWDISKIEIHWSFYNFVNKVLVERKDFQLMTFFHPGWKHNWFNNLVYKNYRWSVLRSSRFFVSRHV